MAPSLVISEDIIDDILYFSRTADIEELQATLNGVSKELAAPPHDVLVAAIEPESGNSALHMAAANGHTEVVKLLLSLTPVPATSAAPHSSSAAAPPVLLSLINQRGNTALHWAALNGNLEIVKALVEAGADLASKNIAGHDAAFEAEQSGKEEVANWLLSNRPEAEEVGVEEKEEVESGGMLGSSVNGNSETRPDNEEADTDSSEVSETSATI